MAAVVKDQPVHARDESLVEATVAAAIDLLTDDASKDIVLSIYGSLGWENDGTVGEEKLTSVNFSVSAYLNSRPASKG
jgi:hypothetical protein